MRAFIAFEISDAVRGEFMLIQNELRKTGADVKWTRPENIHVTLKFLGEVSEDRIDGISKALDSIAKEYKAFEITLFKLGAFPKLDFPRVVWIGIDENCAVVEEIQAKIENACYNMGFERDKRPYSSHLTIGRVRGPKNKDRLKQALTTLDVKPVMFHAKEIILFRSTLTPKGPIYTKHHAARLSTE